MKKLRIKKVIIFAFAIVAVVSATLISTSAIDSTDTKVIETYTLKDGWSDSMWLEYGNANGVLTCDYTNGLLSAPKTFTKVLSGSDFVIQCAVYSKIQMSETHYHEDEAIGSYYMAELELKADFFDSPVSTIQYGFANDGFDLAAGEFRGSK